MHPAVEAAATTVFMVRLRPVPVYLQHMLLTQAQALYVC